MVHLSFLVPKLRLGTPRPKLSFADKSPVRVISYSSPAHLAMPDHTNSRRLTATSRTFLKVGACRLCQECPEGSARRCHDTRSPPEIAENLPAERGSFRGIITFLRCESCCLTVFSNLLQVAVKRFVGNPSNNAKVRCSDSIVWTLLPTRCSGGMQSKQSFDTVRSQAELGNEESRGARMTTLLKRTPMLFLGRRDNRES